MLAASVRRLAVALAACLALAGVCATGAAADPVIAAAGDIGCDPADPGYNGGAGTADRCQQRATSNLLVGTGLSAVLPLGDIQYNAPSPSNLAAVYDPTWGRVKSISHPILGNHEGAGNSYFNYFNGTGAVNGPAGPRGNGYYSFNVGTWHLIALNSNCANVACSAGSAQERWLRADLAAHRTTCTLAFWHHPRWSSGHDGSNAFMQALWQDLYDADADVLLSGHSHDYERFAPLNASGGRDPARGIRQFVVGTGGAFFTGIGSVIANSEVHQNTTFGVLRMTLRPTSYDWRFVPIAGSSFTDSGTALCHGTVRAPAPPQQAPCLPGRIRIGTRALGPIALGLGKRSLLRRPPPPRVRGRQVWRYCVSGGHGGVVVAFSRTGRARLALSTAPGHSRGHIRHGGSLRRLRRSVSLRRRGPGLYVGTGRGRRVVVGFRRGRVRFLGVGTTKLIGNAGLLRRYVHLVGL